jgi:ATP-dependent exoDNAse (exonuclease V) beta subunit
VPLGAGVEETAKMAALQGRILGAPEQEVAFAARLVQSALGHPLLQKAREAAARGRCRREVPITLTQQDGSIVEGIVDLAFLESDSWTVVDFKTDRELAHELDHYKRQVGLYCSAISKATGCSTLGTLLCL